MGASLFGQARAPKPEFEVASLKLSALGPGQPTNLGNAAHGEVTLHNATLSDCIRFAYALVSDNQIVGPGWIKDRGVRFDIDAKAVPSTPMNQLRLMLQALLAERFRLVVRHEQRPVAHVELTIANGGPKLQESDPAAAPSGGMQGLGKAAFSHVSMSAFAMFLGIQLHQPVLDMTGLTGFYDIRLEWPADDVVDPSNSFPGAGLSMAITKLGLNLEKRKTPLEVIVVEHAEKLPIGN